MNFKKWLAEYDDKGFNYYKNMLLGKLNLDRSQGLSQGLDAWEPEHLLSMLNGLGEFRELPSGTQDQVIGQIKSRMGTLGDLVRLMSNPTQRRVAVGNIE